MTLGNMSKILPEEPCGHQKKVVKWAKRTNPQEKGDAARRNPLILEGLLALPAAQSPHCAPAGLPIKTLPQAKPVLREKDGTVWPDESGVILPGWTRRHRACGVETAGQRKEERL